MEQPSSTTATSTQESMTRPKLDLLVLTFNAGKAAVNSSLFADRIETALTTGATALPDVVVISLQEVSPLAHAYIGSYTLNPYLHNYDDALNIAALRVQTSVEASPGPAESDPDEPATPAVDAADEAQTALLKHPQRLSPYTLVRQQNVGMTAIMLFARDKSLISEVQVAEVGFGIRDMGNKGAVAIRLMYADKTSPVGSNGEHVRSTQLTFLAAHLAPMEWNLRRRNQNWGAICSSLLFGDPIAAIKRVARPDDDISMIHRRMTGRAADSAASPPTTAEEEEEAQRLLEEAEEQHSALAGHIQDALHDISIYRRGSHLFMAGDFNYRISEKSPVKGEPLPHPDPANPHHWRHFLPRDQLQQEMRAGRAFQGLVEAPINFMPTYKYNMLPSPEDAMNEAEVREAIRRGEGHKVVPYTFARHRWPSWTDRVVWLPLENTNNAVRETGDDQADQPAGDPTPPVTVVDPETETDFEIRAYDSLPLVHSSDHQPVFLRIGVPLLTPDEMGRSEAPAPVPAAAAPAADPTTTAVTAVDARRRMPLGVDIHSRARRAAARQREVVIGWNLMLVSSKEGMIAIASLLAVGLGGYWLYYSL